MFLMTHTLFFKQRDVKRNAHLRTEALGNGLARMIMMTAMIMIQKKRGV